MRGITVEIRVIRRFESFVLGYCNCGCGSKTRISSAGRLRRYRNNHHTKGRNNPIWRGGITFDKNGYVLIHKPNHPFKNVRGYVQLHRLIMEKHLGRYLIPTEIVHHINGIKTENVFSNLCLFESNSKHISETIRKDMSKRFCLLCKSTKTHVRKIGTGNWYRHKDGFICMNCYVRIKYYKFKN